jgi:hypothetical protein
MRDTRLEGIIGAALAVQEYGVKNSLRSHHVQLPVPQYVQHNYYNHSGDFLDAFVIAGTMNLMLTATGELLNALAPEGIVRKAISTIYNEKVIAALAGAAAVGAVILEETRGYFSTADPQDIYAGIAGAAAQIAVRYLGTKQSAPRTSSPLVSHASSALHVSAPRA